MVTINGVPTEAAGQSLLRYLTEAGYDPRRIAVEHNGDILPQAQYPETLLRSGDVVEIVRFVGGG